MSGTSKGRRDPTAMHAVRNLILREPGLTLNKRRSGRHGADRAVLLLALLIGGPALIGRMPAIQNAAGRAVSSQQAAPGAPAETVEIDPRAPTRPFPHYWERMFGSGRAILTLRESYRRDLRAVKKATDFEFVRFHAIFHDEVGVYDEDAGRRPVYNFSYVDQIYDGLLENGVRPFVELSFMPRKLAAREILHPFWYKPIVSPPDDWGRWGELVSRFAQHLVDRYGVDEVSRWYFEVWNEPNIDFWAGEPKEPTYDRLYDTTAEALKQVSPTLRVGGPATAQAAWVDRFIQHAVDHRVPIDFVSTHVYANDLAQDVFGTSEVIARTEMVARALHKVHDQVKSSARPDLPIIWSEYNASYKNEPDVTDSAYMGPWLADTIRQCDGLADMLSYWTLSDVFEEQGVIKRPFYGGYGLIAEDGVPKPSFNAFKLLHRLGDRRIVLDSTPALVTRRDDGTWVIAVWNLVPPGERGTPKAITIRIKGRKNGGHAIIARLDPAHGSVNAAYDAMGQPAYPTRLQLAVLRRAADLPAPETRPFDGERITLTVPAHGLVLLETR
jgi:xylan 1,4-beta-xylosidase